MKPNPLPMAALCAALVVNFIQAAPEPRRERRPEPPRREEPPPEGLERILDEDQREELREVFRENRERLREIDEQVRAGRRELHEAILEGKLDEPGLKEKIEGVARLEAERQFMRLKALAKIRPTLSEEQIERLRQLHKRRETMGRNFPPGPGRPGEFGPNPRARERYREQIAPPPPGESGFDRERRPREAREPRELREPRFERDEYRRYGEPRRRFEEERPPGGSPPRRRFEERQPVPRDLEHQDAPAPPPSRRRPEPE